MDHKLRFAIHLDYFAEYFSDFRKIFVKFTNQFLIAHCTFNIIMEYCFTLILFGTAKALFVHYNVFYLMFNGKMSTFISHFIA